MEEREPKSKDINYMRFVVKIITYTCKCSNGQE